MLSLFASPPSRSCSQIHLSLGWLSRCVPQREPKNVSLILITCSADFLIFVSLAVLRRPGKSSSATMMYCRMEEVTFPIMTGLWKGIRTSTQANMECGALFRGTTCLVVNILNFYLAPLILPGEPFFTSLVVIDVNYRTFVYVPGPNDVVHN